MSHSGRIILGQEPGIPAAYTRGSLGKNDFADPDHLVCRSGDTPSSLGVNDHGRPVKHNAPDEPVDFELQTHSRQMPAVTTPWVAFQIRYACIPVLLSHPGAAGKIRLELDTYTAEYERKLAKLADRVDLQVRGAADGKGLLDGLVKTVLEQNPKYLLSALEVGIGVEVATDNAVLTHVEAYLVTSSLPIEITAKGTYPWYPGVNLKVQMEYRFEVTINLRPGIEVWRRLAQTSSKAIVAFLNLYGRALLMELVQAGVLSVGLLVGLASGLTFSFSALLFCKIQSQFEAGAMLASCIEYSEAYVFTIYGRTRKGYVQLPSVSESSSPEEVTQWRSAAGQDALEAARKYAHSLSPGAPWSDDFVLKMFREHYGILRQKPDEAEARQLMYDEVLSAARTTKGV